MIGIKGIGVYIPENRTKNILKLKKFNITESFLKKKIGVLELAKKNSGLLPSDLCKLAFSDLFPVDSQRASKKKVIDAVCVCTQNGDYSIPHTSAILHSKLNLSNDCPVFDISLGCTGYVHSLQILKCIMQSNNYKNGLLFTCDPYSEIIDQNDKNTDLLFGDAATVTLLTNDSIYDINEAEFYTDGTEYSALIKKNNKIVMDGRSIFNFVMRKVPPNINSCLKKNNIEVDDIDYFVFHQASKYMVQSLVQKMELDEDKVPFNIEMIGNTVSSTIPIVLKDLITDKNAKNLLLSGFGVGLGIASVFLKRRL